LLQHKQGGNFNAFAERAAGLVEVQDLDLAHLFLQYFEGSTTVDFMAEEFSVKRWARSLVR
jgi:hypothetical protein